MFSANFSCCLYFCSLLNGSKLFLSYILFHYFSLAVHDDLQAKLHFLQENIEPWPTVVQYWTDTSKHRVTELHIKSRNANQNNTSRKRKVIGKGKFKSNDISETTRARQDKKELENVSTYMNKFPALREHLGYTLVSILNIIYYSGFYQMIN